MTTPLYRTSVLLGFLGGLLALALLSLALATHGSQGMFKLNRPAADYAALLLNRAGPLRLDLAIDFGYICVYAAFFVILAPTLHSFAREGKTEHHLRLPSYVWIGALLLTALLDSLENAHILSMLKSAEQGIPIPQDSIAWQAVESQVKFLSSYFGLFLLSFCLPSTTRLERWLVFVLRWVQAPIGIAIFVLPVESAKPFYLARALFFILGFWCLAWVIHKRAHPNVLPAMRSVPEAA